VTRINLSVSGVQLCLRADETGFHLSAAATHLISSSKNEDPGGDGVVGRSRYCRQLSDTQPSWERSCESVEDPGTDMGAQPPSEPSGFCRCKIPPFASLFNVTIAKCDCDAHQKRCDEQDQAKRLIRITLNLKSHSDLSVKNTTNRNRYHEMLYFNLKTCLAAGLCPDPLGELTCCLHRFPDL